MTTTNPTVQHFLTSPPIPSVMWCKTRRLRPVPLSIRYWILITPRAALARPVQTLLLPMCASTIYRWRGFWKPTCTQTTCRRHLICTRTWAGKPALAHIFARCRRFSARRLTPDRNSPVTAVSSTGCLKTTTVSLLVGCRLRLCIRPATRPPA